LLSPWFSFQKGFVMAQSSDSQLFVSMKEVLCYMQSERGFDKRGRRRQVTLSDFISLDEGQRKALAERVIESRVTSKRG
jgi:hypothetical protein